MSTSKEEIILASGDKHNAWLIPQEVLDDDVKQIYQNIEHAGHIWNAQTIKETPKEYIERRVIGRDKEGNQIRADYVKQFYVVRELNRLYPGWEVLDYKLWFEEKIACWICTGVLHIRYYDIIHKEWRSRHIPGTGSVQIKEKADQPGKAFGADQLAKGARTDLIKNCAYWLGIAFDVYSREIPPSLRSAFEDLIRLWDEKDVVLEIATNFNTIDLFKPFVNSLPRPEHTKTFLSLVKQIESEATKHSLWAHFQKQNLKTIDEWLNGLKESSLIKKEEQI